MSSSTASVASKEKSCTTSGDVPPAVVAIPTVNLTAKTRVSSELKSKLYIIIKTMIQFGEYHRGCQKKLAEEHNVSRYVLTRIEKDVRREKEGFVPDYSTKVHSKNRVYSTKLSSNQINEILDSTDLNERSSCRDVASILGVSKSTVHVYAKKN
jgi:hypothetical protein